MNNFLRICEDIKSDRVTVRRKARDEFIRNLNETIDYLNENEENWSVAVNSLHEFYKKEVQKNVVDVKKGKTPVKLDSMLFLEYISVLTQKGQNYNVGEVLKCLAYCFSDEIFFSHFGSEYLKSLDIMLSHEYICGNIGREDWDVLYKKLKNNCRKVQGGAQFDLMKSMSSFLKYGPMHGMSLDVLSVDFAFMKERVISCYNCGPGTQDALMQSVYRFCIHTAKNNRMATCKFGEETFDYIITLYQIKNPTIIKMKTTLIKYLLLQVTIHHPNSFVQDHCGAYASSWDVWNKCLTSMFKILWDDVSFNARSDLKHSTNLLFFSGDSAIVKDFSRLFVQVTYQISKQEQFKEEEAKRIKKETFVMRIKDEIDETHHWSWVYLMFELLKKYPDLLNPNEYLYLLQALSKLQLGTKNEDLSKHLYNCLSLLHDMKLSKFGGDYNEKTMWKVIFDTTVKSFGLNQNDPKLHILLQKLIVNCDNSHLDTILKSYLSGVLDVTSDNLKTLATILNAQNIAPSLERNRSLIRWILNSKKEAKDYSYLSNSITSRLLISLILNKWNLLDESENVESNTEDDIFDEITLVCLKTTFQDEKVLVSKLEMKMKSTDARNVSFNNESRIHLTNSIQTLLNDIRNEMNGEKKIINLIHVLGLLKNINSHCLNYKLFQDDLVDNFFLKDMATIFDEVDKCLKPFLSMENIFSKIPNLKKCISIFHDFFLKRSNTVFDKVFRVIFPVNLLRTILSFLSLNPSERIVDEKKAISLLKLDVMKALVAFCCGLGKLEVPNQTNLLRRLTIAMIKNVYDYESCNLAMMFLKCIRKYQGLEEIDFEILDSLLELLDVVCTHRCKYYSDAIEIIKFLHYISSFVATSESPISKSIFLKIFELFYKSRNNYGPGFHILLVDWIGKIYEVDQSNKFALLNYSPVITLLPEFLCSKYQEVRFVALDNICKFIELSTTNGSYELQVNIFKDVCTECEHILQFEGSTTADRKIDETVNRCATILRTFTSLMKTDSHLKLEALFNFLKIVRKKGLDLIQQYSTMSELLPISILESHLLVLLLRWVNEGLELVDFPFTLYGCENKMVLYKKYRLKLVPFIIEFDMDNFKVLCEEIGKPMKEIVEDSFPALFTNGLVNNLTQLDGETFRKDEFIKIILRNFEKNQFVSSFFEKIDEILENLTSRIVDENDFHEQFQVKAKFSAYARKIITAQEFRNSILFMQKLLCSNGSLICILCNEHAYKLIKLLTMLNMHVHNSVNTNDELKAFHQYAIFNNLIIEKLDLLRTKQHFIRGTCFGLLRFIKHHQNHKQLGRIAVAYLKKCIEHFLPYPDELRKYFKTIVGVLINIIVQNAEDLIVPSSNLLKFLVVENKDNFIEELKSIDDFPKHEELYALREIQSELKKSHLRSDLLTEISKFVSFENFSEAYCSKIDILKNLRTHLCSEKKQLRNLYLKLGETNGFFEDCENSLLHKLISRLVELSLSGNEETSIETLKCLGELGPADLYTLVVKPEKYLTYQSCTPFEFLTGRLISILDTYLINFDIRLLPPSVRILYDVLNIKEGQQALESGSDYGFGMINKEYLIPFLNEKTLKSSPKVNVERLISKMESDDVWCGIQYSEYEKWLKNLMITILESTENCYLPHLIPLCEMKVEFCEAILPSLIFFLFDLGHIKLNHFVTKNINDFFGKHWTHTIEKRDIEENFIVTNKKALQFVIDMVHFIRVNSKNLKKDLEAFNLNYLKIAKAAQYCNAYFTSLLYIELWCHYEFESMNANDDSFNDSILDLILKKKPREISLAVDDIFRCSYKSIGDIDALQGCSSLLIFNRNLRIKNYEDFGMWNDAMFFHDVQASTGIPNANRMLMESFKHCELYESSLSRNKHGDLVDFECLWRLGKWDQTESIPNKNKLNGTKMSFKDEMEMYKFFALKNIHEGDSSGVLEIVEKARISVIENLHKTNLESIQNLYNILSFLRSCNEIEDFSNASSESELKSIISKWNLQDTIKSNSFVYVEPIMNQRIMMLNELMKNSKTDTNLCREYLIECALKLSEKARLENKCRIGMRSVMFVENLSGLTNDEQGKIFLEDAQLCLKMNNSNGGMKILNFLSANENLDDRLRSFALKLNGEWSAMSRSEPPRDIIQKYFLKSLDLYQNITKLDSKAVNDTYITLAKFADKEYQQIASHMSSDIFEKKVKNLQSSTETLEKLSKRRSSLNAEEKKAKIIHERQIAIDQVEIEQTKEEKDFFLHMSIKYYMQSLIYSNDNNLQIFRIMTLFRENRNCELIKETILQDIPKIASHKFLIILTQLMPHLSRSGDFFSIQCNNIINRCARDHPCHTIPVILSLANSNKDSEFNNSQTPKTADEERVIEAKHLIDSLKSDSCLKSIIEQFEFVSNALIELAYLKPKVPKKNFDGPIEIPKKCKILAVENFNTIPVLTDTLRVSKSCNYENLIGIHKYKPCYNLVGGINAPKRIVCIGMDGKPREQLVKGQDDLRQDAVMQQVFTILNNLLSLNKETHGLKIRTYKIVPLSMRSGVLEWAKNTIPLGRYLVGSDKDKGAHVKYRPKDPTPAYCREKIANSAKSNTARRLETYNGICKRFKPVFHKFFEERFLHPTVWYERRRTYTQSVAATSMCGYILGIGDRHVSNVLIDEITAEIVHIDFGIAFEQGRVLPTPETVPFRLTRDIVDGMGVGGVEGIFRRSCEKTMYVLRENHQTIMAILEVLLYDPLYMWTVNSKEAQKRQTESSEYEMTFKNLFNEEGDTSVNRTAERALLRLKAKLHGTEDGTPTSVENQVRILIHQAMDPSNLSKLFHGWQAYL